jgi:hypothetical protein
MRLVKTVEACSTFSSKRFKLKQCASYAASWKNDMCKRYAISSTSAGATGCTLDTTMATILVVVIMADTSSTSFTTMAVMAMKSATAGKVPPTQGQGL